MRLVLGLVLGLVLVGLVLVLVLGLGFWKGGKRVLSKAVGDAGSGSGGMRCARGPISGASVPARSGCRPRPSIVDR